MRYLFISLKEAYSKFLKELADIKIKFCGLRPVHVKLFDHIPMICNMCSYHENIHLLLALKEHTSLAVDFRAFIDQVTCDSSSMSMECNLIDDFTPSSPDTK